ncbi:hypothetical protein GCM10018987_14790 [Streptomyces cremeus]
MLLATGVLGADALGQHLQGLDVVHDRSVREEPHALTPRYTAAPRARTHRDALEGLPGLAAVSAVLSEEPARCGEEAFTVRPGGGRPAHRLKDAVERDPAMPARGAVRAGRRPRAGPAGPGKRP